MDFLRSFYSVDAEFSDTPGGLPGTLRWFKAADGAKTFPADHAWGSLVWEDTNPGPPAGPGEQSRQRVWDKGDRPALKLGDSPDGPLEWFLDGVPLSAAGSPFIGSECDLMSLVNVRNLTASGTYVPTVGTKLIFVEAWGGGGGGGGSKGGGGLGAGAGGGGGAGGYCSKIIAPIASSYPFTIGAAGAGGQTGGNGQNGGQTTFDTLVAGGGNGGAGSVNQTTLANAAGGLGGTASGGDFNIRGQGGEYGWTQGDDGSGIAPYSVAIGGGGGSTMMGGGATPNAIAGGLTAQGRGSGGGGGAAPAASPGNISVNGTAGQAGLIRVWEFA